MRKSALSIILGFILLLVSGLKPIYAQDFTFEKSYQDYVFTQSKYSDSFKAYQNARDAYLKNQTLSLKEEARIKTLQMLRDRDELLRVYLTAVRIKLVEVGGLTQSEKATQFERLDSEVTWYKDHKEQYKDSDPLETLFAKSKGAKDRYDLDTDRKIYDALFNVSLGEVIDGRIKHEEAYAAIRREIDAKVAEGKVKIDPFNRWFTDIENVINQLKSKEDESKKGIAKIYTEGYSNPSSVFKTSIVPFETSKTLLLTFNRFLEELLTAFNALLAS